jgi:sortase A
VSLSTAAPVDGPERVAAPPTRTDEGRQPAPRHGRRPRLGRTPGRDRGQARPAAVGGPVLPPPGGPRRPRGRSRLPVPARAPAPRDGRWWAGAALLTLSTLLVGFVAHVAVLSAFQHHRAQTLAYGDLRTALAKAEAPTGQLDLDEDLVAAGTPVAWLQIPAIGLSEVVLEGSTAEVLRSGPGHRRDSVLPGQPGTAVVLGRQVAYGGPFGDLARLQPGDEITVTTGQGASTYRVFGLRRAGDPLPEALRSGQGRLELLTADGLALLPDGVLHVDAELVSEPYASSTRVMTYPALPAAERAMGQDPAAWTIAFFVLLLLAGAGVGTWWLWTSWGRWHAWAVGVPVLLALGVTGADAVMNALPNLL